MNNILMAKMSLKSYNPLWKLFLILSSWTKNSTTPSFKNKLRFKTKQRTSWTTQFKLNTSCNKRWKGQNNFMRKQSIKIKNQNLCFSSLSLQSNRNWDQKWMRQHFLCRWSCYWMNMTQSVIKLLTIWMNNKSWNNKRGKQYNRRHFPSSNKEFFLFCQISSINLFLISKKMRFYKTILKISNQKHIPLTHN